MRISRNDQGVHICHDCGSKWKDKDKWLLWPVKIRWARHWQLFGYHGVETASEGTARRVFITVVGIGPFCFVLGKGYKPKVKYDERRGSWLLND